MSAAMLDALHEDLETLDTLAMVGRKANRTPQAARNWLIAGLIRPCFRTSTGVWLFRTTEAARRIKELEREAKR